MSWVLVTGGAGFIGTNFLYCLRRQQPESQIINLDLLTYAGNPENLTGFKDDPRYILVRGDVADRELVEDLFSRYPITRVVHFAAESHVDRSILDPGVFVRTNVVGTFTLLEAARRAWQNRRAGRRRGGFCTSARTRCTALWGPRTRRSPRTAPYAPKARMPRPRRAPTFWCAPTFTRIELPVLITNCSNNYGPYQFPEKLIPFCLSQALEGKPIPIYGQGCQHPGLDLCGGPLPGAAAGAGAGPAGGDL